MGVSMVTKWHGAFVDRDSSGIFYSVHYHSPTLHFAGEALSGREVESKPATKRKKIDSALVEVSPCAGQGDSVILIPEQVAFSAFPNVKVHSGPIDLIGALLGRDHWNDRSGTNIEIDGF